jgi:hypothetical protein
LLSGLLVDLLDSICTSLALTRLVSLIQDWVIHVLFFLLDHEFVFMNASSFKIYIWVLY